MSNYYDSYWKEIKNNKLSDHHYKWTTIHELIPTKKNITILDFGCGTGQMTKELIDRNPNAKFVGVDVSGVAVAKAKKRIPKSKFYTVGEGEKIPLKTNSVDFIVATDVIEHVYHTYETLAELARVLKPGGKILVSVPYHGFFKNVIIFLFFFDNYFDPAGPHVRFYSRNSLINTLLKFKLTTTKVGYFGRFYPLSRGMYALAQKQK